MARQPLSQRLAEVAFRRVQRALVVGAGQVVILKFLLRRGFDLELESSTVETRGSVNWRTER